MFGQLDSSWEPFDWSSRKRTELPLSYGIIQEKSISTGGVLDIATISRVGSEMRIWGRERTITPIDIDRIIGILALWQLTLSV